MAQSQAIIHTLKQTLRKSRVTYADIAKHLGMSEANVKRLFSSQSFSLQRLEAICGLIQMELSDLFELHEAERKRIMNLTEEQEQELVSDSKLLLGATSVRNHLGFEEITARYFISETECIQCLARLDRLKIIDLLPGNRIRLLIDDNFSWLPNGPIEKFYQKQIQGQFLKSRFKGEFDCRLFQFGLLGDQSANLLIKKLHTLAEEFNALHRQDLKLQIDHRHNIGLLLAMRPWHLDAFKPLIRSEPSYDMKASESMA